MTSIEKLQVFKPEDKFPVLLTIPSQLLLAKYFGRFKVEQKVKDANYIIKTRSTQMQTALPH